MLLFISYNSQAKKLTVGFAGSRAPWVIPENQSGILIELISEAMEPLGYEINKVFYPYVRRLKSYQAERVDVICDINQININNSNLSGHFSGIVYAYENYAYSLKKNDLILTKINALRNYSILSWQGAKHKLGRDYELMAANNPLYSESHDQKLQLKMLFKERVEVIQIDKYIFEYYRSKIAEDGEIDTNIKVDHFSLFGKNPNGFLFHSLKARNDFVKQIAVMKADGRYNKIFNRYKITSVCVNGCEIE